MARKRATGHAYPVGVGHSAEYDKDCLLRASEVVGDRLRLRAAMKLMNKQHRGMSRMVDVLSRK